MPNNHTIATVKELPKCDFCKEIGRSTPAEYDGKTIQGPWANMCASHFKQYGTGLGLGKGQRLEVQEKIAAKKTDEIPTVEVPLSPDDGLGDDCCEVTCPHCGETRTVELDANYVVTCESCGNKYRVASQI